MLVHAIRRTPTPGPGWDVYWTFAAERQKVYRRRLDGVRGPLTTDPVIAAHRFTNAYRASDRVSQHLIQRVLYADERDRSGIAITGAHALADAARLARRVAAGSWHVRLQRALDDLAARFQ